MIVGAILFYIPFINGTIFLLMWARMLGKKYVYKIFRFVFADKSFSSVREALLHTLKK